MIKQRNGSGATEFGYWVWTVNTAITAQCWQATMWRHFPVETKPVQHCTKTIPQHFNRLGHQRIAKRGRRF